MDKLKQYAYITLLYPNKHKKCTYLDGALLTGLGLRKQNVKYESICMITPDIEENIIAILKIVYDRIVIVDYITPVKKLNGIHIISDIFPPNDYINDDNYNDISNVFTKLHIFNSELFNYDKIIFIDNDLIPMDKYDDLFNLKTPAGWSEQILEDNNYINRYTRICGSFQNIKHGDKIPNIYTKIYKVPGRSINSGLLVIEPNKNIFDNMIKILQTPKHEWVNIKFKFKGSIDFTRQKVDYYILHDQDFLTQYFQNDWYYIDPRFCHWGNNLKYDIYGIHMAGLFYMINNVKKNAKTWQIQIPFDDGFNIISNKIALWGINNFPDLKNILYNNLQFYLNNKLYPISDININDQIYDNLNRYQKKIIDLIKS